MRRENKSSLLLLGLLSKRESSGYDLKKLMTKIARFYWSESNAQIYPILKKLEEESYVTSRIDESSGARQKRIYSITEKGRDKVLSWLHKPTELSPYREEVLLKFGLSQHLSIDEQKKMVLDYQEELLARKELLAPTIEHIKAEHTGRADQSYLLLVYEHVELVLDAKLAWCQKVLKNY